MLAIQPVTLIGVSPVFSYSLLVAFCALALTLGACSPSDSSSESGKAAADTETLAAETDTDTDTVVVVVGQPAPGFELPDETGQTQTLEALNAGKYLVLVFNRGHW